VADVAFHPEAQAEYQAALAWYRARSPRAASGFEAEIERLVGLIESGPEAYPAYDAEHRFAVSRRFPFSIVFQVQPDQVYVVAVAHAARAPGYWQGRT
jgi:hypothetical protein